MHLPFQQFVKESLRFRRFLRLTRVCIGIIVCFAAGYYLPVGCADSGVSGKKFKEEAHASGFPTFELVGKDADTVTVTVYPLSVGQPGTMMRVDAMEGSTSQRHSEESGDSEGDPYSFDIDVDASTTALKLTWGSATTAPKLIKKSQIE